MKFQFIVFLLLAGVSCIDEYNSITIFNTNTRSLQPLYNKQDVFINVALAPIPIAAGKSSTLRSKDASSFSLSAIYTNNNGRIALSFTLEIGEKNHFQVRKIGDAYTYTYKMKCGDLIVENNVISSGRPCQIQLKLFDNKDYIQNQHQEEIPSHILNADANNSDKKLTDNILYVAYGELNSVRCIYSVYINNNLYCQEQIFNTYNYIDDGFYGVNYNVNNGRVIPYENYSPSSSYFQFRIWNSQRQFRKIKMQGEPIVCAQFSAWVTCTGTVQASGPFVVSDNILQKAFIDNSMIIYPTIKLEAKGQNDGIASDYAYLQIVQSGSRYLTFSDSGAKKYFTEPLTQCIDDQDGSIYFSETTTSPNTNIKLKMEDEPSAVLCRNKCYYDPGSNQYHDVTSVVGTDTFRNYLLRKTQANSDTPLEQINWSYTITVNANSKWQIDLSKSSNQTSKIPCISIPTWQRSCQAIRTRSLLMCQQVFVQGTWKQCWVPIRYNTQQPPILDSQEKNEL